MSNVETIEELELYIEELKIEKAEWSDMCASALQSYHEIYELYDTCKAEIKMLVKVCEDNGIQIPDDEHFVDLDEIFK
jgi:hypothetical protein